MSIGCYCLVAVVVVTRTHSNNFAFWYRVVTSLEDFVTRIGLDLEEVREQATSAMVTDDDKHRA